MKKVINLCKMDPDITRKVNLYAQEYKKAYTDFIDDISKCYGSNAFWWVTPLASRNTSMSTLFYDICVLKTALDIIEEDKPDCLIVPDPFIKRAIKKSLHNTNKNTRIQVDYSSIRILFKSLFPFVAFAHNFKYFKKRIEFFRKNALQKNNIDFPVGTVLVDTYVIKSEFSNGEFSDRYFPGIDNGKRNIIYLMQPEFDSFSSAKTIAESVGKMKNAILYEQYVKHKDYDDIINYYSWCSKISFSNTCFQGMKIDDLLNREMRNGGFCISSFYGILKNNTITRIMEGHTDGVSKIIGWYEGQPSSIGLFYRLNKSFDKIDTFAYVLSPCPENNLGIYPSAFQVKNNVVPKYFAVQGDYWFGSIKQFCNDVKCVIAPSFRYSHIFMSPENIGERKDTIVILPYSKISSYELIKAVLEAEREVNFGHIFFKNHPANYDYGLEDYGIKNVDSECGFSFVSGDMKEALKGKKIAIICETTSSIEVLISGIFTVMYIPKGKLSMNCVPQNKVSLNIAFDKNDLVELLSKGDCISTINIKELRDGTFSRVDENTVNNFLTV